MSGLVRERNDERDVSSTRYEQVIVGSVEQYLMGFKELGIDPPILCFLAIQGASGAHFRVDDCFAVGRHVVDRDPLVLPDITIDDLDGDIPTILRPVFDMVWNACGYLRSFNFDEHGKWKLQSLSL